MDSRGFRRVATLAIVIVAWAMPGRPAVRPPAVAGSFYPADPAALRAAVATALGAVAPSGPPAIAVVAPHAGYVFSAVTAGRAFAELRGREISRVILLGPSHRSGFIGAALPASDVEAFATPLGTIPLDTAALAVLRRLPDFSGPADAHRAEHSLEVELPFLQVVAPHARVVPVLVGRLDGPGEAAGLARALAPLLGTGTVVVASSDFTHHGSPYRWTPFPATPELPDRLKALARATAGRAAAVDPRGFSAQVETSGDTVCGARPIAVLLELLAHAADARGRITGVTTSAAVSGDLRQVVAYAGVAFRGRWTGWREVSSPPAAGDLSAAQGRALVELARAALTSHLGHGPELAAWFAGHEVGGPLLAPSGTFVTINNTGARAAARGRLRGCIGSVLPREPLVDAVLHAAVAAAHDPRFPTLEADELDGVELEVSVLSAPRRVPGPEAVELGRHGVILTRRGRTAVFLPQVATETGWDRETFLSHLARKAGLPADAWRDADLDVFTAQVFTEGER